MKCHLANPLSKHGRRDNGGKSREGSWCAVQLTPARYWATTIPFSTAEDTTKWWLWKWSGIISMLGVLKREEFKSSPFWLVRFYLNTLGEYACPFPPFGSFIIWFLKAIILNNLFFRKPNPESMYVFRKWYSASTERHCFTIKKTWHKSVFEPVDK